MTAPTRTTSTHADFVERHFKVASRSGSEYSVLCPLHGERNASMRINVDKGAFICHGCGQKGGIKKLARLIGVTYRYDETEATLALLLDKLNRLAAADAPPAKVYEEDWLVRFQVPTKYWTVDRGFTPEMIELFDLGYDPFTDAAVIPIRDVRGRILGVTRRYLDPDVKPRYKDPTNFNKAHNLFASCLAFEHPSPTVVITEGPLDAIKVWQTGVPAVAQYGSSITPAQIKILKKMGTTSVVLFYDNDEAGQKCSKAALGFFKELRRIKGNVIRKATNVERWRYDPAMDLRRHFLVKRVNYKGVSAKDPGAMSTNQIRRLLESARHVL